MPTHSQSLAIALYAAFGLYIKLQLQLKPHVIETWVHVAESTMQKTIARLGPELKEVPLEASKYIKPRSVLYTMDGTRQCGAGILNCSAVA